jgi:hypothetical protein
LTDRQLLPCWRDIQRTLPPLAVFCMRRPSLTTNSSVILMQSIQSVLNAKLLGAWHLHQATVADFTETFCSVLLGHYRDRQSGQANYVLPTPA